MDLSPTLRDAAMPYRESGYSRAVFLGLLAAYLLLILYPILHANRYYNDDLVRTLLGNYGWNNNGRHLANLLMRVLQFGAARAVDIAPLPQFGAVVVLAWIGLLAARRFRICSPLLAVLLVFPLGAQPFFLENLSYRYDALGMALSMLFALLPVLSFVQDRRGWWLGALSLLASLSFYQPAFNVFLIFCLVELAVLQTEQTSPSDLARTLLFRALQASVVLAVYKIGITPSLKDWTLEHSESIHGMGQLSLPWQHALEFLQFTVQGFPQRWSLLFAPFAVVAALVPMMSAVKYAIADRHRRPGWQTTILLLAAVLGPPLALICAAGPMLLLVQPVFVPRVMLGIGALLSGALIVVYAAARQWPVALRWQCGNAGVWALGMVVCASTYGNALSAQQHYEDRIASELADDMTSLRGVAQDSYYLLDGSAGFAVETARVVAQFPLMDDLVSRYLGEAAVNEKFFLSYYRLGSEDLRSAPLAEARVSQLLEKICALPPLTRRSAYELRKFADVIVVSFNDSRAAACPKTSTHDVAPVHN